MTGRPASSRDHRPRLDTTVCPDQDACARLYHPPLLAGGICECCGADIDQERAQHDPAAAEQEPACEHVRIVIAWTCPMGVVIDRENRVISDRRYSDESEKQVSPTEAFCRDCYANLPAGHPAVLEAEQIQNAATDWPAGSFGW